MSMLTVLRTCVQLHYIVKFTSVLEKLLSINSYIATQFTRALHKEQIKLQKNFIQQNRFILDL